ncbi:DUF5753 domain-containing protein [Streptomyces sp. NPDC047017]|uniref:DUF5753 domain-containing protein n=1 Tax=Streptomyces sp. NPDC047017 TaxID=3155024 RepID=UPI003404B848
MAVSTAGLPARIRFGQALKEARLAARKPDGEPVLQADASRALRRKSIDRVSRLELGKAWPQPKELETLLDLYGVSLERRIAFQTMVSEGKALARDAWWKEFEGEFATSLVEFLALEDSATGITTCAGGIIPGLLQTADYARTLTGYLTRSAVTQRGLERAVELRTSRRRLLERTSPPEIEAVIGQGALEQQVGGSGVMAAQLGSLLNDAATYGITLRVIPFAANATIPFPLNYFEFGDDEDPIFAFDAVTGVMFRKTAKEVRGLKDFLADLRELALSPEDSIEAITSIQKEMSRD